MPRPIRTHAPAEILERTLVVIQRRAANTKARRSMLNGPIIDRELEELRQEYRDVHQKWRAAVDQTSLDV